jgi:hypothetical protein
MKFKVIFEGDVIKGPWGNKNVPSTPEPPIKAHVKGSMPDHEEGIHDHLAAKFKGDVYRDSTKTTTMFENRHCTRMENHLSKQGWDSRTRFGVSFFRHPGYEHEIHVTDGWRGFREMRVHHGPTYKEWTPWMSRASDSPPWK